MVGRKIQIKGGKAKTPQVDLDKKSRIKRENCFVDFLSLGQTFMTLQRKRFLYGGKSEWKADQVMNAEIQGYKMSGTFS